jgi:DnaJ-class molecular chaperone
MPFCVEYDPVIHCHRCKGWGSIREIGSFEEVTCGKCRGTGAAQPRGYAA